MEHGTDRSAQIIILLIFVEIIEFINKKYLVEDQLNKLLYNYISCFFESILSNLYYSFFPLFIFQPNKKNF